MTLDEITKQFATAGSIGKIQPHGGGHINDSYHLVNNQENESDYLLQKINHYVFKDVDLLMNNISMVTYHITDHLKKDNQKDLNRRSLTIVPTTDGALYFKDPDGNYWRIFNFIKDHVVFEATSDPELAYEGARMFGSFTNMLSGINPSDLGDTIPKFHSIKWRFSNLKESIAEDAVDRVKLVRDEIRYVETSIGLMSKIQELGEKGSIPLRVTHNDTKINNVLFDRDHKGLCVIDLDTVMPGYVHYDFGDGIRTFTNTGEEDDEDLNNISMDLDLYRAFASGFLESTREILNKTEIETLVYAGLLFPYIMGVRFLTDYIAGDVYYKTKHKEHNLVRAKAQLKLAMDGESKLEKTQEIIKGLV
ncbi:MAG: aminoglycoside phosphotransferase family protein [Bacteroidales bacterium]|nr:aminoglycoside phosphotransferase family protein [Bacteroidales bacterium]